MINTINYQVQKDTPYTLTRLNQAWEKVLHLGEKCTFPAGSIIQPYYNGKKVFYYIQSGNIQSLYVSLEGREKICIQFTEQCLFAIPIAFQELPFFREAEEKLSFFQALTDVELVAFSTSCLEDVFFTREHPELIISVMRGLSSIILVLFHILTSIHTRDIRGKLSAYILQLYEQYNCMTLVPNITQERLASILGVHRTSLARTIKELRETGIISGFTKRKLIIYDMNALKKFSKEI